MGYLDPQTSREMIDDTGIVMQSMLIGPR